MSGAGSPAGGGPAPAPGSLAALAALVRHTAPAVTAPPLRLRVTRDGGDPEVVDVPELPFAIGGRRSCDLTLRPGVPGLHGFVELAEDGRPEYRPEDGAAAFALEPGRAFKVGPFLLEVLAPPGAAPAPAPDPDALEPVLENLLELLPKLWAAEGPDALLPPILDCLRESFGADWAGLYAPPEGEADAALRYAVGDRPAGAGRPLSRTVLRELLAGDGPLLAPDLHHDPTYRDAASIPAEVRAVIAAPLARAGADHGVVYLESRTAGRRYTGRERALLGRACAFVADLMGRAAAARAAEDARDRLGEAHRLEVAGATPATSWSGPGRAWRRCASRWPRSPARPPRSWCSASPAPARSWSPGRCTSPRPGPPGPSWR